jgi:hypothetical protein
MAQEVEELVVVWIQEIPQLLEVLEVLPTLIQQVVEELLVQTAVMEPQVLQAQ